MPRYCPHAVQRQKSKYKIGYVYFEKVALRSFLATVRYQQWYSLVAISGTFQKDLAKPVYFYLNLFSDTESSKEGLLETQSDPRGKNTGLGVVFCFCFLIYESRSVPTHSSPLSFTFFTGTEGIETSPCSIRMGVVGIAQDFHREENTGWVRRPILPLSLNAVLSCRLSTATCEIFRCHVFGIPRRNPC